MTITKDFNRQAPIVAMVEFSIADIAAGVAAPAIDLPPNAIVLSGDVTTLEAWNSTSTDVIDVGDAASANRYLNDGNFRALAARVPLVPTGYVHTGGPLTVLWASGGGSPDTGKARLTVEYVIKGRSDATHG